ncbi:MAG: ATP-binding protein [Firmicutes bacterium]|nr:ATP-binding protein [Bacillota bacterium]
MCYKISKSLSSDLMKIKHDLETIINNLKEVLRDETLVFDARLIIDELICNGVLHGNKSDKTKKVKLNIEISSSLIKIEVMDQGEGFVYNKEDYDPMKLTCNGRGLKIVDGLSDEFIIENNKAISIKYI